ncbi:MAG: M20/M25/M40 family metallo-hydrolase [Acidobacteriota bacterium]|nr:M20/M25/M40 family metallo-hydrolase [Acidobacteriota bacterium]MDH3783711.1 M20/M25/M40 family metallo-hydrolase [Acidobacteriota bacterium]
MANRQHVLTLVAVCLLSTACIHRSSVTRHESPAGALSRSQASLRDDLARDVDALAAGIGPRHAGQSIAAVLEAERWIVERLRDAGLEPERDEIDVAGTIVANVVAILPGTTRPDEVVLVGAHYDTVIGSPGADDNASGVALLLAMAARLVETPMERTVRIVFFVNEEDPFTGGMQMGSRVHADRSRERGDDIVLMLNVDSVGYYKHDKGSQKYPRILRALFPSRGNFVVFATDKAHRRVLDRVVALYQEQCRFPTIGVATDSGQINRGDHASFLWRGYPALAISDTSEFRNPNYHRSTDEPATLDLDAMARMGEGFVGTVRALAGG